MIPPAESALPVVDKPGRLDGVEALRGMAAIMVLLSHAAHINQTDTGIPFGNFWQFGRSGVDFFFVLSGFIISYIHAADIGRPAQFGAFWAKRLLRIYPAYLIISLPWLVLLWISPTHDLSERNPLHVLASLVLWPEIADPVLGVGWSLRHELSFYCIFSLMIWRERLGMAMMLLWFALIFGSIIVQLQTGTPAFDDSFSLTVLRSFNIDFALGITVAWLLRRGNAPAPRMMLALGAVWFLATGMYESYGTLPMHEWPVRTVSYGLAAALLLAATATLDRQHVKVPRLAVRLGAASYSIYLLHVPLLVVMEYFTRPLRDFGYGMPEIRMLVLSVLAIIGGVLFSESVEQPLLRWGRRRIAARPNLRSTPVVASSIRPE